ncbi:hypothetical protein CAPTEDRAFT_168673 [Capitella teleta]|uniref:IMP2-like protein n=1 Tax=Capitella teleta TaxID=283909 RepID=R7UTC3_CAPTE|nr:hypothetical protein CAPTEDRAFT_168673 [Capitella teleta]|eukprot:ELU06626.1 hypothetical protein CAPTEDRAFT_168673 [Capitella teleta]
MFKFMLRGVCAAGALYCTFEYGMCFTICSGDSMQSTIYPGDIVLNEYWSVFSRSIKKGDVVIFRSPEKPLENRCKRVTGVEGDIMPHTMQLDPEFRDIYYSRLVPRGHLFVEGDNMHASRDSRHYGPVPYGLVRGKVIAKIWPPSDIQQI